MYKIKYVGGLPSVEIPSLGKVFERDVPVEVTDEVAARFEFGRGNWAYETEWYEKPDVTPIPEIVEGGVSEEGVVDKEDS